MARAAPCTVSKRYRASCASCQDLSRLVTPDPMPACVKALAIHFGSGAPARVAALLARQNPDGLAIDQRDVAGGSIGCVGGTLPTTGNVGCVTGAPINGPDDTEYPDAQSAIHGFPQYDGPFAGVYWDDVRRTLVIATDCLGMQPLYMRRQGDDLTVVSNTRAVEGDPDLAAWGAFLSIGHPIGNRSLVDGLVRVPPASVLTYEVSTRKLDVHSYWSWPDPSDAWRGYDFLAALQREMEEYAGPGSPGTLLLSGGFDSRLLLFLLQRARIPADALIVAHDDEYDDLDGRLAESVAKTTDITYRKVRPAEDFFSSPAYLDYLEASDAGFPSLDLFIAKVASQIRADAVWDGLAPGFVFMPLHQYAGGFAEYLRREIRGPDSTAWQAAKKLFRPEVVEEMRQGFERDLSAELERLPRDEFGLTRLVIENRSRNRPAMNPLKVYAGRSRSYTPGIARDFMAHAAIIPYREKIAGRFYRRLLARLDRRALAVPFVSGGELLPNTRFSFAYHEERLRMRYIAFRHRHPSLSRGRLPRRRPRSTFLGPHLLDDGDPWIAPGARELLKEINPSNYTAWKLLFHWKAWRWVHEGRLHGVLGPFAAGQAPRR